MSSVWLGLQRAHPVKAPRRLLRALACANLALARLQLELKVVRTFLLHSVAILPLLLAIEALRSGAHRVSILHAVVKAAAARGPRPVFLPHHIGSHFAVVGRPPLIVSQFSYFLAARMMIPFKDVHVVPEGVVIVAVAVDTTAVCIPVVLDCEPRPARVGGFSVAPCSKLLLAASRYCWQCDL